MGSFGAINPRVPTANIMANQRPWSERLCICTGRHGSKPLAYVCEKTDSAAHEQSNILENFIGQASRRRPEADFKNLRATQAWPSCIYLAVTGKLGQENGPGGEGGV